MTLHLLLALVLFLSSGCAELMLLQEWEAARRKDRIERGLEPGPEVTAKCGRESVRGTQPNVTWDEEYYKDCMARAGWPAVAWAQQGGTMSLTTPFAVLILAAAVVFAALPSWSGLYLDAGARAETECRALVAAFVRNVQTSETREQNLRYQCLFNRINPGP